MKKEEVKLVSDTVLNELLTSDKTIAGVLRAINIQQKQAREYLAKVNKDKEVIK
jgi:hypothetical protein